MLIVLLFVLLLPFLIDLVSFNYTNYYLTEQKKKVLDVIDKNGLDYYLQGDKAYASYTMLKEEYISLIPADSGFLRDTIETSKRVVEEDTLNYRILIHKLKYHGENYVLEIGKTTATIGEYNRLWQQFTLYILIGLIVLTLLIDLIYTNILLRPLSRIIKTKLLNRKFPFKDPLSPIKTSTTDFKLLDDSLINLMEKIHKAFDKEREFTSNASHELMTPISILQTNVENLMMEEDISEELQERLSTMMKTISRLKRIVHSLLYISRIENDQFVKSDVINIHGLIEEVMEELSSRLETKSLRFINEVTPETTIQNVNRDLIFQLLYNLINNAIRYNKESGFIHVHSYFSKENGFHLVIEDTGVGIKEEEIGTIFNRFKKAGKSLGEGHGLGLSIVKSIILFHDFKIEVQSTFDEGTKFIISIPAPGFTR